MKEDDRGRLGWIVAKTCDVFYVKCTGINEKPVNTGNRCLLRSGAPNGSFR